MGMEIKPNRPFQISCGLREGYDQSALGHTIEEAREVIQKWIEERTSKTEPVAVGTLLSGEFIYPWIENSIISSRHEPAINYRGRVREDTSDEKAIEMLNDLANRLATSLKQKRVHVEFRTEYWVVET